MLSKISQFSLAIAFLFEIWTMSVKVLNLEMLIVSCSTDQTIKICNNHGGNCDVAQYVACPLHRRLIKTSQSTVETSLGSLRYHGSDADEKWICVLMIRLWLFQLAYFFKLQANSSGAESLPTISKFRKKWKRKFRRHLFMSSIKHEMRLFHVVVVQWWQLLFAQAIYCLFDVLVAVAAVAS